MSSDRTGRVDFPAHQNRSSEIEVSPEQGVLLKKKPGRNPVRTAEEFFKLRIWNELLGAHNGVSDQSLHVGSPTPTSLDLQEGEIGMTVCYGFPVLSVFAKNHPQDTPLLPLYESREQIARRLGRLTRIKQSEGLMHGDFHHRHLLFDPADIERGAKLSVIDVENSRVVNDVPSGSVFMEDSALWTQVLSAIGPGKKRDAMRRSFTDGYEAPLDYFGIIPDIVAGIYAEGDIEGVDPSTLSNSIK